MSSNLLDDDDENGLLEDEIIIVIEVSELRERLQQRKFKTFLINCVAC